MATFSIISDSTRPVAIRISKATPLSNERIYSESLFIDYLSIYLNTICKPIPIHYRLVNHLIVGENKYDMVVFRKGNGVLIKNALDDDYLQNVGKFLGKMHHASMQATIDGFHYKRPIWYEMPQFFMNEEKMTALVGKDTYEKCLHI